MKNLMCQQYATKPVLADQITITGDHMTSRFEVVPAIPKETGSFREGSRFFSNMAPGGFSIYDNKQKCRLPQSFSTRDDAQAVCGEKNSEQLFSSTY
jgi:hypothetical protein